MYDVALSVLSCLRAETAVHVAWVVSAGDDVGNAVAITPGGGRIGELLGGSLDHAIANAVTKLPDAGALIEVVIGPVEALVSNYPEGSVLTLAVLPGTQLPSDLWEDLAARLPVTFALQVDGTSLSDAKRLDPEEPGIVLTEDRLVTSLVPVPRVVISGSGPIAESLSEAFSLIGWKPSVVPEVGASTGVMATMAALDAIVVLGHDVETAGRALQGAIDSNAGYIASIGSGRMQALREEWLAYRGVEWDGRIHGPAGLPIGAENPAEIAISIVAEALSALRQIPDDLSELD